MDLAHGTVQMYRKHLRLDEEACADCKAAQARYIDEYRKNNPRGDRTAETRQRTIRQRALRRLAEKYPQELAALMVEEQVRSLVGEPSRG